MATSNAGAFQAIDVWGEGRLSRSLTGSRRSSSSRHWGLGPDNVFARRSESRRGEDGIDDEEALRWAALEKLPTYDRMRTTILEQLKGSQRYPEEFDLRNIAPEHRYELLNRVFNVSSTEEDNEKFLRKFRDRLDRVDVRLPTVEVRYENLDVQAEAFVGGRALPTLYNEVRNTIDVILTKMHIPVAKKQHVSILHDVSGIIKPSRLTLLLGPPASGKTSLLLALAGNLDKKLKVSGEVTYNGHHLNEFTVAKTAAYISQHDLHIGEMTVRETLDFSAKCQGVGQRYDLLTELVHREKDKGIYPEADVDFFMKAAAHKESSSQLITDYTLKVLGLDICADTMVGDDMRRGISGGQKKRVTTGEMIVGPMKTLFMDEISTGLDSSTTYQIVRCLRDICHVIENTILISLLQPAPETFNLFDDLILLSESQVVYHGPRDQVLEFFEDCGFRCPERKGVADFLQEVTSKKDQQQYWADKERPYRYVSVMEFAELFKSSDVGRKLAAELGVPYDRSKSHKAALVYEKFSDTVKDLFWAVYEKEWLLVKRNSFIYVFKSTQIGIMALISMSVYFRTEMHRNNIGDAVVYAGALFFGIVNIMFNGFAELSLTVIRLPVLFKQRDLLLFPPWTFALSTFIQRIPFSFLESLVWIVITYYPIGFAPEAGRFFRQLLLFFWVHMMSSGLFRLIAGLCRNMIIANTGGSVGLLIIFILGGFIIPRTSIKPWWIWGYWISPLAYAQNAVQVNEFLAPEWGKPLENTTPPVSLGVAYLKSVNLFTGGYWYWIAIAVMIGYTILFNVMFGWTITYLDPLSRPQAIVSEEQLAKRHAERTGEELPSMSRKRHSSLRQTSTSFRGSKTPRSLKPSSGEVGMSRMSSVSSRGGKDSMERMSADFQDVGGIGPAKKGMILPFLPLSISFNDVNYYVDMPLEMKQQGAGDDRLQLLREVTGAFRPGVLTALVGVSGAGKSTLMDVLAGRKTGGYIEGDIRISGYPKVQSTFARIAGYCEQNDIHSPQVTVYESVIYSAWLRLPKEVDDRTKMEFVDQVMDLVELENLKHSIVGLPGVSGLSTEQRKRLTIAVELVANPSIIFMDEPTSGLDARAAAIVMRTVRNTVDTGRTVVCTIHQPSIDIFEAFDELLLLKRGGQVIYAGPLGRQSHMLVKYFEELPGVPKIKEGYNPATWMLEVSSPAMEVKMNVDFAEIYRNSTLYQKNKALVKELSVPNPNSKDLWFPSKYSQSLWKQFTSCLWKQHLTYWRSPDYNAIRILFTFMASLLFGTIFWGLGKERNVQASVNSVFGALFAACLFLGVNNSSTVMPVVATERTVFYRERAAGMYSAVPFGIAQVLIEIPYNMVQVLIYGTLTYAMIQLEWTVSKFAWYMYFLFTTFLFFTYYGMMAVALTPNHQIASIVSAFFYNIFNLFSGFLIPKTRIPKWWIWYYWACPVAWTLYGLIASQYGDLTEEKLKLSVPGQPSPTIAEYVETSFGFKHSFLPVVGIMMAVFPTLFAVVFVLDPGDSGAKFESSAQCDN
ncbi:hypothetical protein R1flu_010468 [Riccia fluitans]|uniref:ABC transporter domain-containing protein n=1 Tax=Riccia fluitans TaxID=41844 RepID=A0ABD1Z523_9MARC